ncbi:MAG TPA: protein kinase, partial [Kofleriaceae bacterium]|nr:protein kinase [Kofleriaceae bacterium]
MPELPTTFGKYYLTEKLATGGMAEIYLAKLIGPGGFEKHVVIKQILPKLSGQRHFVDLFVAEAKTLVTLAHGNIVPVYELGVVDDTYFIAMDYIDGPTLYRLTEAMARREERMAPAVAAGITAVLGPPFGGGGSPASSNCAVGNRRVSCGQNCATSAATSRGPGVAS